MENILNTNDTFYFDIHPNTIFIQNNLNLLFVFCIFGTDFWIFVFALIISDPRLFSDICACVRLHFQCRCCERAQSTALYENVFNYVDVSTQNMPNTDQNGILPFDSVNLCSIWNVYCQAYFIHLAGVVRYICTSSTCVCISCWLALWMKQIVIYSKTIRSIISFFWLNIASLCVNNELC